MPHILVVDGEERSRVDQARMLEDDGHTVERLADGVAALDRLASHVPDLMIFDLVLPGLPGIGLCKAIRDRAPTATLPALVISALSGETEKVAALNAGADDYLVKPVSERELLARVNALLRRAQAFRYATDVLRWQDLVLDRGARRVRLAGQDIHLGPIEFQMLAYFMERMGRSVRRQQLKEGVWGTSAEVSDFTVTVNIGRLRKALSRDGAPDPIRTVRGEGYRFGE